MYFPLEVNEQLANAMRAAAEFKVEVEKIIECICVDENGSIVDDREVYEKMSDNTCLMMVDIWCSMGVMLTDIALNEVRRVNSNQSNTESHVSK